MTDYEYDFSNEAADTDKALEGDINRLGALSTDEIAKLLPKPADQDELKKLIAAVNAETTENQKKARLLKRLGEVSEVVKNVALQVIQTAAKSAI